MNPKNLFILAGLVFLVGCNPALKVKYCGPGDGPCVLVESDKEYADGYRFHYKDAEREITMEPKGAVTNNDQSAEVAKAAIRVLDRKLPDLNPDGG